ncbi:MAG: hypothetical protein HC893_12210 [Chloroflexaceae bacterium]|nr:hypothetical protein [Chloroflexaceae bacterium]
MVEVAAAAAAEVQALEAKVAVDQLMVEKVQTTRSYADHNCGFSMPQTTASTAGQE